MRANRVIALVSTTLWMATGPTLGCSGSLSGSAQFSKVGPTAKTTASPSTLPVAAAIGYTGRVLGLDGNPAANVTIRGYLIGQGGSTLIGQDGAGIVAGGGGNIVAGGGGNLIGQGGSTYVASNRGPYRLLGDSLETRTDATGGFRLTVPDKGTLNIEAVQANDVKAILLGVAATSTKLTLQLAPTGTIAGKVTATKAAGVTNFEGVDVFIPGTGYIAKTDKNGLFTLGDVPVGTFELVASKSGLGRASAPGVIVKSKVTAEAALDLALVAPVITSVGPPNGGPGSKVRLVGKNFGATAGETLQVTFGGTFIKATRVDDQTIEVEVPDGDSTNEIIVTVGGVASNGASFNVIKSLSLTGNAPFLLLEDGPKVLVLEATDTRGNRVVNPTVNWTVDGSAATVDGSGLVTPQAPGDMILKVTSGNLATSLKVSVKRSVAIVSSIEDTTFKDSSILALARDKAGILFSLHGEGIAKRPPGGIFAEAAKTNLALEVGSMACGEGGQFYLADTGNNCIWQIDVRGKETILAGLPTTDSRAPGDFADGAGTNARFDSPQALAFTPGRLYVADSGNNRIRMIDLNDPTHPVSTVAGKSDEGIPDGPGANVYFQDFGGLALDGLGHLYVSSENRICQIGLDAPSHPVSTLAGGTTEGYRDLEGKNARFSWPRGLAVNGSTLYVADSLNNRIRKVALTGQAMVSTVAGNGGDTFAAGEGTAASIDGPGELVCDDHGTLYLTTVSGRLVEIKFSGSGKGLP